MTYKNNIEGDKDLEALNKQRINLIEDDKKNDNHDKIKATEKDIANKVHEKQKRI